MRRNPNARRPGPQRKRRDKLNRTTLFDDSSGGGTRRHDLASRALAGDGSRPIGFEDLVDLIAKSNGPPKSSRSPGCRRERLATRLNDGAKGCAAILQMDGRHYDGCVLFERVFHARKGAPETFRLLGLLHMLDRLRRNLRMRSPSLFSIVIFEISRAGARLISRSVRALIVEGNYLLLDQHPWSGLHAMFDITVAIDAPEDILRQRLVERWLGWGFSPTEIGAKVEPNYLPNGRYIMSKSTPVFDNAVGELLLLRAPPIFWKQVRRSRACQRARGAPARRPRSEGLSSRICRPRANRPWDRRGDANAARLKNGEQMDLHDGRNHRADGERGSRFRRPPRS